MAARAPVEIGTQGTVGSLLLREIEYFKRLELGQCEKLEKPRAQISEVVSAGCSSSSATKSGYVTIGKKKKKKRGTGFLPSLCSAVEAVNNRKEKMTGLSYKNLKMDGNVHC